MTMPKRINPSQEKLHRVKTRTGDTQSGYLEEKLAGSRYVNIIEEDGASGKRLRIELDGASVSAEISDHKVKVDNADTAEYLENKITAGDNIVLSKETSGGKKNIKVSALVPDVVNQVYFTNEILIQSGVTEVAGKVYNTYANFLAYVSTLPPVSKPSNSNPWVVQLPSGRFDELVTFIEGVSIRGRNTILHTVKSEFTVDFTSGFSMESVLANLSYIKDCVVERFDFSNSVVPTVIPIIPIFGCFVTDKNLTQNGTGIVIACGSQFNELNFQEDLSGNALVVAGFNCIFKGSVLPPMANIDHSSLFGCTINGGEYSNCHIAGLSRDLPSKFGAGNDGRIKLSNCKIEGADFLYSLTTNPYGKRIEVFAENTAFKDSRFFAGSDTSENFFDNFVFTNCSFDSCVGESVAGTTGCLALYNCFNAPWIDTPHYKILEKAEGNQIFNEFGILEDSNLAINQIRNASEKCIAIEIQEADLTQGNTIKATKKLPANCMITKMMYVGDIEFISNNGTLRVGLLSGLGDKGAVIGSISERNEATEIEPFIEHKAVTTFTLDTTTTPPTPIEPEAISAGSEVAINVELDSGHATGNGMIYIFYCVPMY